jgi:hypothetical protein
MATGASGRAVSGDAERGFFMGGNIARVLRPLNRSAAIEKATREMTDVSTSASPGRLLSRAQ